ncbi:MAG: polysaccharide export protein [Kiritimatiellae bacterium]|nr:polysaccharide export protein [Kiritimatiellia bacterium]
MSAGINKSGAAFVFAAALAFAGCYMDRLTGNYDDVAELDGSDDESAVIERTGQDDQAQAERERRLTELAAEEEPVYRMNAGDEIEIRVYDHADLGMTTKIGPDGNVGFAFLGQVGLGGLTISEGAEKIRDGLAPYVKSPVVSITVRNVESATATIAGACVKPGVYGISNTTRLADLYAIAGASASRLYDGATVDVADLDNSVVVRRGEVLPVDFRKAVSSGDELHNIRIRRGDYIYIAQRMDSSVTICGEVKNPQRRIFESGMGLIEALTSSGWMLETHWKNVIIIRDGLSNPKFYKVDVDGILAGKRRNVALRAGDIVYVPRDNLAEYNVFVRKLLPTAQIIHLLSNRSTRHTFYDNW